MSETITPLRRSLSVVLLVLFGLAPSAEAQTAPSAPATQGAAAPVTEPDATKAIGLLRAELIDAFNGVTAYLRSPAQGAWTAPDGRLERDVMVMVEVLTDTFDRPWWRAYAEMLARRFDQEEIHIRALPAETPRGVEPV